MKSAFLLPLLLVLSLPAKADDATPFCSSMPKAAQKRFNVAIPILPDSPNALLINVSLIHGATSQSGRFIVDTGATYSSISQDVAEALGLDLENTRKIYITTGNGRIPVPMVTIDTMTFGDLTANNLEVAVMPIQSKSFIGLIGLNILRQFVVTFDLFNQRLLFKCFP